MADLKQPVRLHVHWAMKPIAAVGVAICPVTAYSYWQEGNFLVSAAVLMYACLAAWVFFLADTTIDVDRKGIRVTAPHGVYVMDWAQVKSVEMKGPGTILFGDNKALSFNLLLAGKGKREFREFVAQMVEDRQVPRGRPPGVTNAQIQKWIQNTKVRGLKLF